MYIIIKNQFAYVKNDDLEKVAGTYTDSITDIFISLLIL